MRTLQHPLARRTAEATIGVFGQSPLSVRVHEACTKFESEIINIQSGRGIKALLIAIVGAKGQGKTWIARQLVRTGVGKEFLKSGDLLDDSTTRLVWIGPVPPEALDLERETYLPIATTQMVDLGQPFVLLDTPGITDSDKQASQLAAESLSLAPIKVLAIARDQIRAAANLTIAQQIDGAVCIPVITSVEPKEASDSELAADLRSLREQLSVMAPHSQILAEVLVPDFEVTGDEEASGQVLREGLLDRIADLGINAGLLGNASEMRLESAARRFKSDVNRLISTELPQLAEAVSLLNRETEQLPARVLASLLGSESVLETGLRMRLRTRLAHDTSMLWFPYRTVLSVLNLTHGAWDRIVLALTGSVPSLFGALASWAKNVQQSREFSMEVSDGIRQRTQAQVEERLRPLCDQFHRTVMKLRPREDRTSNVGDASSRMKLLGIEELQTRSQEIFEQAIERNATSRWTVQVFAFVGTFLFWALMAAPIAILYREYISATISVWLGGEAKLDDFPSPKPGQFFTSLLLSILPLMVYCMIVLTGTLRRKRIARIARGVAQDHEKLIDQLQSSEVIRMRFEDELLEQAEFLLNLR